MRAHPARFGDRRYPRRRESRLKNIRYVAKSILAISAESKNPNHRGCFFEGGPCPRTSLPRVSRVETPPRGIRQPPGRPIQRGA